MQKKENKNKSISYSNRKFDASCGTSSLARA